MRTYSKSFAIILMIFLIAFAFARRDGDKEPEGENRFVHEPRGKFDFNMEGHLVGIEENYLFFNDQKIFFNPSQIEAYDSLGRKIVFSSIEPPAKAKLVIHEKDGKLSTTAVKIIKLYPENEMTGVRSVNTLQKVHSPATYNLEENRMKEFGEDAPPPIDEEKNSKIKRSVPKDDSKGGLQIERE